MSPRFAAIATVGHAAPAPSARVGAIQEQPAATLAIALANQAAGIGSKQIGSGGENRVEQAIRTAYDWMPSPTNLLTLRG